MAKKNTTSTKTTPSKKPAAKKISAVQAGKIIGLHERYALHLKKKYVGQAEELSTWADLFLGEGLIEEKPKFLA